MCETFYTKRYRKLYRKGLTLRHGMTCESIIMTKQFLKRLECSSDYYCEVKDLFKRIIRSHRPNRPFRVCFNEWRMETGKRLRLASTKFNTIYIKIILFLIWPGFDPEFKMKEFLSYFRLKYSANKSQRSRHKSIIINGHNAINNHKCRVQYFAMFPAL